MNCCKYLCAYLAEYLWEGEMFQTNFVNKDKTLYSLFTLSASFSVYEVIKPKGFTSAFRISTSNNQYGSPARNLN
jgi:hypothetical protein